MGQELSERIDFATKFCTREWQLEISMAILSSIKTTLMYFDKARLKYITKNRPKPKVCVNYYIYAEDEKRFRIERFGGHRALAGAMGIRIIRRDFLLLKSVRASVIRMITRDICFTWERQIEKPASQRVRSRNVWPTFSIRPQRAVERKISIQQID